MHISKKILQLELIFVNSAEKKKNTDFYALCPKRKTSNPCQ